MWCKPFWHKERLNIWDRETHIWDTEGQRHTTYETQGVGVDPGGIKIHTHTHIRALRGILYIHTSIRYIIYVCIHTHIYIHTYIYIHIHTHTYIYIHMIRKEPRLEGSFEVVRFRVHSLWLRA